ncbi:mitogen-activated protein kinase kinase kinase 20-like [Cannabis sativa]|uniref:mitogen-activated protein kinase kinase kinase 20-like n=1 Tax=Cannabis sativa TaxID=3483 RepID=UPI0029C9EC90|nr:mitogen-activated protein kinase kinase kinase 20-like [Cannabis sativa]
MMRMVMKYRQEKDTFVIKYNKRQRDDEDSKNNKRSKYGGWVKEKLLGRGGFGCVNLVKFKEPRPPHYKDLPELLAVKSALNDTCSKDLVREMKVYEYLGSSPFIVKCYGQLDNYNKGEVNMAMEYASGGSLASAIENKNNGDGLSEWEVKAHTCSILKGLEFIHRKGFVHCDLKPANILLVADDDNNSPYSVDGFVAKIADFGLAKTSSVRSNNGDDEWMRRSKVGGTLYYLSPEAVLENTQEEASDIWAVGCVVLQMLTGLVLPWYDNPTKNQLSSIISIDTPCSGLPSDWLSKNAWDFLFKCFTRNPNNRPSAHMLLNHSFLLSEDHQENDQQINHNDINVDEDHANDGDGDSDGDGDGEDFEDVDDGNNYDGDDDEEEYEDDDDEQPPFYDSWFSSSP